jgi:hypothetical protein
MEIIDMLERGKLTTKNTAVVDGQEISLDATVPKDLKRG